MQQKTFILFGRSGSGKGTQAHLLRDYLANNDPEKRRILYIETGSRLREFKDEASYTAKLTAEILDAGKLMPSFVPIWIWTDYLIRNAAGNEHLVLDGISRHPSEAAIIDAAMQFYKRERPYIINLNVSEDWARARLLERKRSDDSDTYISERLHWYRTNVLQSIELLRKNPLYHYVEVNGEQPIENVHKDIVAAVDWS
jgi:adenylate kinase family enzyme